MNLAAVVLVTLHLVTPPEAPEVTYPAMNVVTDAQVAEHYYVCNEGELYTVSDDETLIKVTRLPFDEADIEYCYYLDTDTNLHW